MHVVALAAILACAAPGNARAQATELGFRGGWTSSSFRTDRVDERAPVHAPSLGASLTLPVRQHLAIQPELLLALKGSAFRITLGNGTTSNDSYPIAYVEVPVLARVTLPTRAWVEPYIAAGPYSALRLHCVGSALTVVAAATQTGAAAAAGWPSVSVSAACARGDIARVDVGAVGAAGAEFPLGRKVSGLMDVRYEVGARNIVAGASGPVRNQMLALSLGLSFPLGLRSR